jgi:hypothetical protein
VGDRLHKLKESDMEIYYSEVKNLLKIIQWKRQDYLKQKNNVK